MTKLDQQTTAQGRGNSEDTYVEGRRHCYDHWQTNAAKLTLPQRKLPQTYGGCNIFTVLLIIGLQCIMRLLSANRITLRRHYKRALCSDA